MGRVRFSDVVKRVNVFVDREHTDLLYYVGGEHIDSDAFMVRKNGLIKGATIGYKFHFGFQPGHMLSHVQLFVTPWTTAGQAPLSMGFPRQEY